MKIFSVFCLSFALVGASNAVFASEDFSDSNLQAHRKGFPCFNPCVKNRAVTGPTGPCCTGPTGPAGAQGTPGAQGATGVTGPAGAGTTPIYGQIVNHGSTGRFSPTGSITGLKVYPLAANTTCTPAATNMAVVPSISDPTGANALLCTVAGTYRVTYSFSGNILNGVDFNNNPTSSNSNPVYQLFIGIGKDALPNPTPFNCTRQNLDGQIPRFFNGDSTINQQFVPVTVSGDAFVSLNVNDRVVLIMQNYSGNSNPTDFGFVDAILTAELVSIP